MQHKPDTLCFSPLNEKSCKPHNAEILQYAKDFAAQMQQEGDKESIRRNQIEVKDRDNNTKSDVKQ